MMQPSSISLNYGIPRASGFVNTSTCLQDGTLKLHGDREAPALRTFWSFGPCPMYLFIWLFIYILNYILSNKLVNISKYFPRFCEPL